MPQAHVGPAAAGDLSGAAAAEPARCVERVDDEAAVPAQPDVEREVAVRRRAAAAAAAAEDPKDVVGGALGGGGGVRVLLRDPEPGLEDVAMLEGPVGGRAEEDAAGAAVEEEEGRVGAAGLDPGRAAGAGEAGDAGAGVGAGEGAAGRETIGKTLQLECWHWCLEPISQ